MALTARAASAPRLGRCCLRTATFLAAGIWIAPGAALAQVDCPVQTWRDVLAPGPQGYKVTVARDLGNGRTYAELAFGAPEGKWPKLWAAYVFDGGCFHEGVVLSLETADGETFLPLGLFEDGRHSVLAIYTTTPEAEDVWNRAMEALDLTTETVAAAPDTVPPPLDFR